ncbi:Na+/H+ antiporter [Streptacidiphilus sp. ASG 303]|uniref:Na+/H+ antiporter n=1 Tax=Streptacidiphilus sp. ASG 303 TaxID=2896847 RepID=UPI001E4BE4C5|nr:Na+/H+ antiporter [Streptacidiphilus sp. ASG 303]MCD0482886.1 Na+/H+ antiporter [Streptacidiphilus sp. ASG 303]
MTSMTHSGSSTDLLLLVAGAAAVAGVARKLRTSAPLLLVAVGLAASYLPGVPAYTLDPHLVLPLVLPPLLYTSALDSSFLGLRAQVRPVALLAVGYVLFCTVLVGLAAYVLVPGLPLAAAFVLGAVVAPPDAVAATAIARRVGLPRTIVTILQGESLANDATAITAYRVALAAAVGEGFSWGTAAGDFLLAALGGTAVGLVLMVPLQWVRVRLADPLLLNTFSLLVPFAAYAVAEAFGASGVIAVVVVGLYLGHEAHAVDFATRLQEEAVWRMVSFVLESTVFALIGLQLRLILDDLGAYRAGQLALWATAVLAVVVVGRFVWTYATTYLPPLLGRGLRRSRPAAPLPPWNATFVIAWAGMRGVVSLAVAFSIPATVEGGGPFPGRELILFLTFAVVVGTLLLQGLTLPALVRVLRLPRPDRQRLVLTEAQAQSDASHAALDRLDVLLQDERNRLPQALETRLRRVLDRRQNAVWERLGAVHEETGESADATYRRLSRELVEAERQAFVRLRDQGRIDDELLRTLVRRLDLEEAMVDHDEE